MIPRQNQNQFPYMMQPQMMNQQVYRNPYEMQYRQANQNFPAGVVGSNQNNPQPQYAPIQHNQMPGYNPPYPPNYLQGGFNQHPYESKKASEHVHHQPEFADHKAMQNPIPYIQQNPNPVPVNKGKNEVYAKADLNAVKNVPEIPQQKCFKGNIKNDYELDEIKERHFHGCLRSAIKKSAGTKVDVQIINKYKMKDLNPIRSYVIQNLQALSNPPNSNVQKILDFYEDKTEIYVICEQMDEVPFSTYFESEFLSEFEVASFIKNLLLLINQLHKIHLPFPNINLNNIRVKKSSDSLAIKLGNNGLFLFDEFFIHNENFIYELAFFSPQRVNDRKKTLSADVWAIGIFQCILLTGKLPFHVQSCTGLHQLLKSFVISEKCLDSSNWSLYSKEAMNFSLSILSNKSIEEILNHSWLNPKPDQLNLNLNLNLNSNSNQQIKPNDKENIRVKKKALINLFNLQKNVLTYICTNNILNKKIDHLRGIFQVCDKTEDGFIPFDQAKHYASQSDLLLTEKEITNILGLLEKSKSNRIDYTILISKIIDFFSTPLEEEIKHSFKGMEHVMKEGLETKFVKFIIDPNFQAFEETIKSLVFELNLYRNLTIPLNDFLLMIHSNCRAKSTKIKL